jgi:hypothetical protein
MSIYTMYMYTGLYTCQGQGCIKWIKTAQKVLLGTCMLVILNQYELAFYYINGYRWKLNFVNPN